MVGAYICPLLILGFGQWNMSGSVSVLVLNRSFKKHCTFPPFLWRICRLHGNFTYPVEAAPSAWVTERGDRWSRFKSTWRWEQTYRATELQLNLRWHRWTGGTNLCYWTSEMLGLFVIHHCLSETDWYSARAGISNQQCGSEITVLSSCHIWFLLIPLFVVLNVLSTPL